MRAEACLILDGEFTLEYDIAEKFIKMLQFFAEAYFNFDLCPVVYDSAGKFRVSRVSGMILMC
jgi:hypothetical protein